MQIQIAKLFSSGNSQAVRLSKVSLLGNAYQPNSAGQIRWSQA